MDPAANPLFHPSPLPYGLPPFDRIRDEHVEEAVLAGLAAQAAEWETIATDPADPTVANTLEALERSGTLLHRALKIHWLRTSALIDDTVTAQEQRIAPLLAAHSDRLHLDTRLFARVDELHDARHDLGLDEETLRLVERTHLAFVRAGARLDDDGRAHLRELNEELSRLGAAFRSALVAGANAGAIHVVDRDQLAGLPDDAVATAAAAAAARGLDGWVLTLVLPTPQPVLAYLHDRELRRQLHEASVTRGFGGAHDTRAVLSRIAALRAERAALLGFADHAAYVIADQTAGDSAEVGATLRRMAAAATANADGEAAELTRLLRADGGDGALQPWDWLYYADRRRVQRHGVDEASLRPYFELDRVVTDGVMAAAAALFGITFARREDLPTHHPDVRVYEVHDVDGSGLGLCLIDPFARDSKRGGAWMDTLVDQSQLLQQRPVVTMTLNVPPPPAGQPALMTLDEVETAFHEFGHVLHGLFSDVRYPRFSGTSVPRDFVEFPSQVNEMWTFDPAIVRGYARHHATGEPLPADLIAALERATLDGQGFATTEYLAAALLDLAWHSLPPGREIAPEEVEAFEAAALADAGIAHPLIPPRYRSAYFSHIFGGGYSAAYYAYIWSEILDAELVAWFTERGGLQAANGRIFRERLLSRGGAVDPMAAFEAVRGRPPTLEPLLARRGLG